MQKGDVMGNYVSFDKSTMSVTSLTDALVVPNSGLVIDPNSIQVQYGNVSSYYSTTDPNTSSISFYTPENSDQLGIGSGLLLSSGTAVPNQSNTSTSFSTYLNDPDGVLTQLTDDDLGQTAKLAFSGSGEINDATVLQFDFTIDDLFVHGIKFDLVFGSEEYPEYSDSNFVDIAGVYLNGKNIALFNAQDDQPLSVISKNLDIGNFIDNGDGHIPIEYDGVSNKLTINTEIQPGKNTLKIAIADTGDSSYDSALYIANLEGTQLIGGGLTSVTTGSQSDDNLVGTQNNETIDAGEGNDIIDPGAGNDVVLAGDGDDTIIGGIGDNQIDGGPGIDSVIYNKNMNDTYVKIMDNDTIHVGSNSDNLLNVEHIKFNDVELKTHDLFIEDDIAKVYIAYFGRASDPAGLQYWLNQANAQLANGRAYDDIIFNIVSAFSDSSEAESIYTGINAGVMSESELTNFVSNIYLNLFNREAEQAGLDYWVSDGLKMQANGINIGTIVKTIIDGAQDQPGQLDRTFMQNKAQIAWDYAKQYQLANASWDEETHASEAQAVLTGITTDSASVNAQYDHILTLL